MFKHPKIDHVIIIHGIGASSRIMWFPWLRRKLEQRGIRIDALTMPRPFHPDLADWRKAAQAALEDAGPTTMIIGHSLGGTFTVRMLEEGTARNIGCVVLVSAPIARPLKFDPVVPFFSKLLDWHVIQKNARRFLLLHAKNDPVVAYDHTLRYGEFLGVRPLLIEKGGHFDGPKNPAVWDLISPFLRR